MNEPLQIHGFRVVAAGKISADFKAGLRLLASRCFADASCTIVKTAPGARSGITHAGGRYVHRDNASATSVAAEMRDQGIEPPPMPFLVAPGKATLFHEWGHHVDRVWSGDENTVLLSFRWFSRFYEVNVRGPAEEKFRPIESQLDGAAAAPMWWHAVSELFANLFEDWLRGERRVSWDCCEPAHLNGDGAGGYRVARLELLPGMGPDTVRQRTYALFEKGLRGSIGVPEVRSDLFGGHTARTLEGFVSAMNQVRSEAQDAGLCHRDRG